MNELRSRTVAPHERNRLLEKVAEMYQRLLAVAAMVGVIFVAALIARPTVTGQGSPEPVVSPSASPPTERPDERASGGTPAAARPSPSESPASTPEPAGPRMVLRPVDLRTLEDVPGAPEVTLTDPVHVVASAEGSTLAAASGGGPGRDASIEVFDTRDWPTVLTRQATVTSHVGWLTALPDALVWMAGTPGPSPALVRQSLSKPAQRTETPLPEGLSVWELQPLTDDRLALFTVETDAGPPHLLLVDAATGHVETDLTLRGIAAGGEEVERSDVEFPVFSHDMPGLAWDTEAGLLYIAHADAERVTVVDLESGDIVADRRLNRETSLLDRIVRAFMPAASAKFSEGVVKSATLSPDGSRLYVSGVRHELEGEDEPLATSIPLGLTVVETADLTVVEHLDLPAQDVHVSPDGFLLLTGTTNTPDGVTSHGLHVLDPDLTERGHVYEGTAVDVVGVAQDGETVYLRAWQGNQGILEAWDLPGLRRTGNRAPDGFAELWPEAGILGVWPG